MADRKRTPRDADLSERARIKKRLLEVFADVEEGFINQGSRSDDQMDYWDCFNCKLSDQQFYAGNSKLFIPIVHDAINARKTRFTNQVFPKAGRYVEVIDENGEQPHALMALAEHYVRKAKLRTLVAPALNKNGDIEGQYNLYVDWQETARHVVWRAKEPIEVDGVPVPGDEVDTIKEDVIFDAHPTVEVLSDADVLILPATVDSADDAIAAGGSVTVIRRWGKGKIREMIDDGDLEPKAGEDLLKSMGDSAGKADDKNPAKKHADAAGIKAKGKQALVYETWTKLKVDGGMRICRAYYGGDKKLLGCKLNPYWSDRIPVISAAVDKVSGVAKGQSLVKVVAAMQYAANDIANEGADSATYSMLPIIMTDPVKNPKVGSMVLDLAAVWECDPNSTKFASFPQLWKDSVEMVQGYTQQIFRTLSVNPSMIPQSSGGAQRKRNQAEVANEQSVDILTTADAVGVQEESCWTPIIERFMELDAQFRDEAISIRQFGQMGRRAAMEQVPPLQMGKRYEFRWFGVEQARNAAQVQQKIALLNILKGTPPQLFKGREFDAVPLIENIVEDMAGPRLAPLIFRDIRDTLTIDPEEENEMLEQGFDLAVHPGDDDVAHMRAHMTAMGAGDAQMVIRVHIQKHQAQMQAKAQAAEGAKGTPGSPGGAGPGVAGSPRQGAMPGPQRPAQQPPGAIANDQMGGAGAVVPPRRA